MRVVLADGGEYVATATTVPPPGSSAGPVEQVHFWDLTDARMTEPFALHAALRLVARIEAAPCLGVIGMDHTATVSNLMHCSGDERGQPPRDASFAAVLGLCLLDIRWLLQEPGFESLVFFHKLAMLPLLGDQVPGLASALGGVSKRSQKRWLPHRLGETARQAWAAERWAWQTYLNYRRREHRGRGMDPNARLVWRIWKQRGGLIEVASVRLASRVSEERLPFQVDVVRVERETKAETETPLKYQWRGSLRSDLVELYPATADYFKVVFEGALRDSLLLQPEGLVHLETPLLMAAGSFADLRRVACVRIIKPPGKHRNSFELQLSGLCRHRVWKFTAGITNYDKLLGETVDSAVPHAYAKGAAWVLPFAADCLQDALDWSVEQKLQDVGPPRPPRRCALLPFVSDELHL
jgi:hypothetical protein